MKNVLIADLGIKSPALVKKISDIGDTRRLYALAPAALKNAWRMTDAQFDLLNDRLTAHGLPRIVPPDKPKASVKQALNGKCKKAVMPDGTDASDDDGALLVGGPEGAVACARPIKRGKQSCEWHWLLAQPIADQVAAAEARHAAAGAGRFYVERSRVPKEEWPDGHRWCSGCQDMVPLFYTRGSKCVAHASQAAHASMIKRVYEFTAQDYSNLLAWQRGKCYICRQTPRVKRLAVDHDHKTGEVRGLLCANDEWGCNRTLARVLNNVGMAERLLAYVQKSPVQRMRDGEPSPSAETGLAARVGSRVSAFDGFLD